MNTKIRHGNQAGHGARMRGFCEQETLLAVISALDDIAEDLADGRAAKALHGVRDLSAYALEASRNVLADHASLTGFPPIHKLDAALHAVRRTVLERRAAEAGLRPRWSGDEFCALDEGGNVVLEVDEADNWRLAFSLPDWFVAGSGLISLLAALRDEPVSFTVSSAARWLKRGRGHE